MKKFLLFVLFCFSFINVFSQLDREHWFGAMMDRSNQTIYPYFQTIYMSTDQTTPFKVEVYNNNVIVGSVMVSKGNPQKFILTRNQIITTSQSDLFKPISKGIYLKGEKPFFANLRFSVNQHAEIVTSKGTAGKGTEFYTSPAPIASNLGNVTFMTSVMATEDNTQVTINGFNSSVHFSDNVTRTQFSFTLQKGQSYIIDGRDSYTQNWEGFIGAKITSTKPVIVTNGNFNGQYVSTFNSSTDILMDQSVPVDKLGKEFALVKGNGTVYQPGNSNYSQNMEKAFIVATTNNTNIYVNNETTPINPTPLNAGDHIVISSEKYINQGNGQRNMYIKATENVYVFQLLAGASGGNEIATGGYNYIPPLSCYLPKKIDELGLISENEGYKDGSYDLDSPTKLNIITEKGATVQVLRNGVNFPLTSVDGPYNLSGTNNWVTYSIARSATTGSNSVSGNMTVISSKAVTAGISAGDGAVGYGGYFAGFSALPLIIKTGKDCLNEGDVFLELTPGFDYYQWYERDLAGNETLIPGANSNIYQVTHAGIYFAKLKQGSCDPVTTQDYKFYNCDSYTNYDYNSCGSEVITPHFTLSTQTVDPATVKITLPPTQGTAVVNTTTGKITYTAFPNASGIDKFKFSFKGIGAIPDTEEVQITVQMIEWNSDAKLEECSINGIATYNLTLADVSPDTTLQKSYFTTHNGAENNISADQILNFSAYTTADTTIYVRLVNSIGCVAVAPVVLKSKLAPDIKENLYTQVHCDEDIDGVLDGTYKLNVNSITPIVLQNSSKFTVRYYDTEAKANTGGANNITGTYSFAAGASIWIRVDSPNGCPSVIKEIILNIGTKVPLTTSNITQEVCDVAADGSETINLADYLGMFTTTAGATATYFNTLANAQNNTAAIPASQIISADKTFYYRIKAAGYCDEIGTLSISFTNGTPSTTLQSNYKFCDGDQITLDAGTGFTHYLWSTGETTSSIEVNQEGDYWVDLTNTLGCIYHQKVKVTKIPKPQLDTSAYNGIICDNDFDGTIHIKFSTQVTPVILQNASSYTVTYYGNETMTEVLPDQWTYNTPTTVYVSVTSEYCSPVKGSINFGFGNRVPLITSVVTSTVCDNNLNGTESVKLTDYLGMFTAASGATAKYFNSLADAQNNTGAIPATQNITGNKTFYYRIKAAGYCDEIGILNLEFHASTPSPTLLPEYIVCETGTTSLDAGSGYTDYLWSTGDKTQVVNNVIPGTYWVDLTNSFGCIYRQTVKVTGYPVAQPKFTAYNSILCDEDFDGKISVKFSTDVTPVILPNASLYTTMYYANPEMEMTQALPDDWYYTEPTTVYVEILSPYCPPITGSLHFDFGNRIPLLSYDEAVEVCDDNLDGIKSVDLSDYKNLFTNDNSVQVAYFDSLTNAEQNIGSLSNPLDISGTKQYYLRFSKTGFCSEIAKLKVTVKIPKISNTLEDKDICPGTKTNLDAGPGFDQYLWSTNETSQSISVGVGDYWVDLTYDGCTYRQFVSVKEVDVPIINSIEITGTTVTINVSGGNPPYQYSLNGIDYQDSNIFYDVPYGQNTAYVISAEGCLVIADFTVIRLLNVITPNGDGYNDYLDYSDLQYKESVLLKIFDRNGLLIFTGEKSNNYRWDGKIQGRPVNTGSYWYVLQWRDPNTETLRQSTGWVMVKNRD